MNQPKTAGIYEVKIGKLKSKLTAIVECGSASGIYCRAFKMGGSSHCGFKDWDRTLTWTKVS